MTGKCGNGHGEVNWRLQRFEDGRVGLFFEAEKADAEIGDYDYVISSLLPPWEKYAGEITHVKIDHQISVIGKQCFRGMERLKKVEFQTDENGNSFLRVIGDKAFMDCRSLETIEIPDSVEEIGSGVFHNAERLSCVKIGSGLKAMGSDVFSCAVSLRELSVASVQLGQVGKNQFRLVHLLQGCDCPAETAGVVELRRQIGLLNGVGTDKAALSGETSAVEETVGTEDGLCGQLSETVTYCLKKVGNGQYELEISGAGDMPRWESRKSQPWKDVAEKITAIRIGEGITSIGDQAFAGLIALKKISLPKGILQVGVCSLAECVSLTELHFQEGLRALGCRSIWGCVGLKRIWLPKTFAVADLMALAYCPNISELYYGGSKRQWEEDVIIDNMMRHNQTLLEAPIYFGENEEEEKTTTVETGESERLYREEIGKLRKVLASGGDGRLHSVAVGLGESSLHSKIGDSTLVIFPEGKTMLIDTGSCGARHNLTGFLRDIGLDRLDYLVFTHPHGDHFGGALELIRYLYEEKNSKIGEVWYSGGAMEHASVKPAMDALVWKEVPYRQIKVTGDSSGENAKQLDIDGVNLFVYGPNEQDIERVNEVVNADTANDSSLVFKFCFENTVFLTAGDIYKAKEKYLIDTYGKETFRADVLKMNHHGNYQGNTQAWIEATLPRIAYAETDGDGNNDVIRRYREAGATCYSTGLDGMLHFSMGPDHDIQMYHQFDSKLRQL